MGYALFVGVIQLATSGVYACAIWWLYLRQERLLFEPDGLAGGDPICTDEDTREFFIDVPGARLSVAHMTLPNPRGVF